MIYADANVIIRLLEGEAAARHPVEERLQPFRGSPAFLATSRLSRLECRCKPLREGNVALLGLYERFFNSAEVVLLEISPTVVEKATELRAQSNLETPDALHLASAILANVAELWTGDRALIRCTAIPVIIV